MLMIYVIPYEAGFKAVMETLTRLTEAGLVKSVTMGNVDPNAEALDRSPTNIQADVRIYNPDGREMAVKDAEAIIRTEESGLDTYVDAGRPYPEPQVVGGKLRKKPPTLAKPHPNGNALHTLTRNFLRGRSRKFYFDTFGEYLAKHGFSPSSASPMLSRAVSDKIAERCEKGYFRSIPENILDD